MVSVAVSCQHSGNFDTQLFRLCENCFGSVRIYNRSLFCFFVPQQVHAVRFAIVGKMSTYAFVCTRAGVRQLPCESLLVISGGRYDSHAKYLGSDRVV